MSQSKPALPNPAGGLGILTEVIKRFRLAWHLFTDKRVPLWAKAVLPLSWLYVVSPVDFLPDLIPGLGQLDDIGVILLGMALFVKLCPPEIVQNYVNQLAYGQDNEIIDVPYRVIDEDKE